MPFSSKSSKKDVQKGWIEVRTAYRPWAAKILAVHGRFLHRLHQLSNRFVRFGGYTWSVHHLLVVLVIALT